MRRERYLLAIIALFTLPLLSSASSSHCHTNCDSILADQTCELQQKLDRLKITANNSEIEVELNNYFEKNSSNDILNLHDFNIFSKYITNVNSPIFISVTKHQRKYSKLYGKKKVSKKIFDSYISYGKQILKNNTNAEVAKTNIKNYYHLLNKRNVKNLNKIKALLNVELERNLKNWKEYISCIYMNEVRGYYHTPDDVMLYSWAIPIIYSDHTDEESLVDATEWLDRAYWACNKSDSIKLFYLNEKIKLIRHIPSMAKELTKTQSLIKKLEKSSLALSSNNQN